MFLDLAHTKFDVFRQTKSLVLEVYKFSYKLPVEERYSLTQQIRRAALSSHLNLCEGFSRRSNRERGRFFEVSRGSVIEVDSIIDICVELKFCRLEDLSKLEELIKSGFNQLSALIKSVSGKDSPT